MARKTYPSEEADRFIVRLPDGMRERLKAEALENKRSMNAEIVDRLEQTFKLDEHFSAGGDRVIILEAPLAARISKAAEVSKRGFEAEVNKALEQAFPPPPVPTPFEFYDKWIYVLGDARGTEREALLDQANAEALAYWPDRQVLFHDEGGDVKFLVSRKPR